MAMTRDDIIRMAREADLEFVTDAIEFFANLVAAAEREECAKRLDAIGCDHCATNIRLRGQ
jgi:hypothetical protein